MTESPASYPQGRSAVDAWRTFWFRPQATYTLGLVRIVFGSIIVAWSLTLLPELGAFFGSEGAVTRGPDNPLEFGLFEFWTDDRALVVGWTVLFLSAVALTVGWHSRIAAVLVWALVVSFEYRNSFVFNSGDGLLRVEALILALAPTGSALSLDQRRRTGSFWSAQMRAPWALRLLQIHLTLVYLATFVSRMSGEKWLDGTALSYALRLEDMLIIPVPQWVAMSPMLMNIATWSTLLIEVTIAVLIWVPRCRRMVILVGVALHCAIMVTIAVGFFTPAMLVLYLAFAQSDSVRRLPEVMRTLGSRRHAPGRRRTAETVAGHTRTPLRPEL